MKKVIPFSSERDSATNTPPTLTATARSRRVPETAPAGPEQLMLLLQRLIGCTEPETLIHRFFVWAEDLLLADGLEYAPVDATENLFLGARRHHSAHYDLNMDGNALGSVRFCRRERYSEDELMTIEHALGSLARSLQSALAVQSLRGLVTQDPLTGLGSRASLQDWMNRELARARRHESPFSVMMIDVDHFKAINDRLGHLGGDQVLRTIAKVLRKSTRKSDLAFRFGGDEFTILLPHTGLEGAREAARQIRANLAEVSDEEFGLPEGVASLARPDVSIGIACHQTGDDEHSLLQRADTHLYHAKAHGRARVCTNV